MNQRWCWPEGVSGFEASNYSTAGMYDVDNDRKEERLLPNGKNLMQLNYKC
ncbi:hypothetical protein OBV_03470 [Oscillibacter valericigenes Sjm18-20]|nr:hypothetical protein OBV_03470 [Oscillibacter valericigenes Sjm18-20]